MLCYGIVDRSNQNYIFHSYPTGESGIYLLYGLSEEDKINYEQQGYQVTCFDTVSVLEKQKENLQEISFFKVLENFPHYYRKISLLMIGLTVQ